jgi:hypothetical protein
MAFTNEQIQQLLQLLPGASTGSVNLAGGGVPGYAEGDLIGNAYQSGDYATANRLIAEQKLSPQDVINKYNLNAAQSSEVAKNLGYTGDLGSQNFQYGTGYVAPTKYTDQDITSGLQSLVTQNLRNFGSADPSETAEQLKAAIKQYNPDITQVNRIINSGVIVPYAGGSRFGGQDVNLNSFADDFAMATSKTPLIDANGKMTLDPKLAVQAAQNELDTLFDLNRGTLIPIKNSDFDSGGKYYDKGLDRNKMIVDWYNDPANKAKIDAAQKTVFDKYGVPTDMRLAPRAISPMLAQNEVRSAKSAYVDPMDYASYADYTKAQNAASLKAFEDELAIYKKYGMDKLREGNENRLSHEPFVPSSAQIKLANLRAGLGGRDPQQEANFYGMTLENLNKAKSGRDNSYFNTLRTPLERLAEETARSAGIGKPNEKALALAKKYPDIFSKASKEWAQYLSKYVPQKKAGGGKVKETTMPDGYRAGGRVKLI